MARVILKNVAPGLTLDPAGYWIASGDSEGRYPESGSDFCAGVEEASFWFAHRNRMIISAVRRYPPLGPIFDVGAGNGYVTAALAGAGYETLAIEPSEAGVRNALARGVKDVVRGVLPSSAFREMSAGGIGLFDVVEHTPDDRGFLAMLRPYLKREGRLYLTVPAYGWLWSREDVNAGHYRRYTLSSLRAVLKDAGYELEYATYFFWWLPGPIFVVRVLGDRLFGKRVYEPSKAVHGAGAGWTRSLALTTLGVEQRVVSLGLHLPVGGSVLAVASRDGG